MKRNAALRFGPTTAAAVRVCSLAWWFEGNGNKTAPNFIQLTCWWYCFIPTPCRRHCGVTCLLAYSTHCRDSCYIVVTNATALLCIPVNLWHFSNQIILKLLCMCVKIFFRGTTQLLEGLEAFYDQWPITNDISVTWKSEIKFCGEYCESITGMHTLCLISSPPFLHLPLGRSQSQFCQLI